MCVCVLVGVCSLACVYDFIFEYLKTYQPFVSHFLTDPLLLEITIMGIDSRVHKLEEQLSRIERNQNLIVQRLSNVETFCSQLYQFTQGPHNYPPPNPFYCTRL